MFKYTLDNKRYHTLNYHLKALFNDRVFKAVIDGGFSCPNIDGSISCDGCSYCREGSGEFTTKGTITEQLDKESERIRKKWGDKKIIAYFQAHTNTYAPVDVLKKRFEEALEYKNVIGLSIATRADCIEDDVFDYLEELSKRCYLTVELGLQSVKDETAEKINRGYKFEAFERCYNELKRRNIRVVVHIINGLIGEDKNDMINTARVLGKMKPDGVKIHLLHVLKGTKCEKEHAKGLLKTLTKEEYIDIVTQQLRYFCEDCVIERVTGDGARDSLIAPEWSLDKISVLGAIDKAMADKDIYQGDRADKTDCS